MDVSERRGSNETSLLLRLQGKKSQTYELRHLGGDTFEWALLNLLRIGLPGQSSDSGPQVL